MTKDDLRKITGLAIYFENSEFENLTNDLNFRRFVLSNSEVFLSFLTKAYSVDSLDSNTQENVRQAATASIEKRQVDPTVVTSVNAIGETPVAHVRGLSLDIIEKDVIQVICAMTGYPEDMIETEIDLEADLGVDTVKKMEIMADLAGKYKMSFRKDFNISHVSTVKSIAKLVHEDSLVR